MDWAAAPGTWAEIEAAKTTKAKQAEELKGLMMGSRENDRPPD